MGFSFIEREGRPDVLPKDRVLFYNALETCVVKRPTLDARVYGYDKFGNRLSGNGCDVLIVNRKETPVDIRYQPNFDTPEQSIGAVIRQDTPNITP